MKAVIFAAGLGTRLQPLTNDKPKALVEIAGKTLLEHAINYLKKYGIQEFVINIHHFGDLVVEYLDRHNNFGVTIHISDERQQLLNTGGGLVKMEKWLANDPFIVYNVDIITDIDLDKMVAFHIRSKALATLAVRNRTTSRYLLFDDDNYLRGWKNMKTGETIYTCQNAGHLNAYAFSGVHVIDPAIFQYKHEEQIFSIIHWYLDLAKDNLISGYVHDDSFWLDVGKLSALPLGYDYMVSK
ncbi:MAG: NDP-sugar synthase [Fidelibacterota bacterium]